MRWATASRPIGKLPRGNNIPIAICSLSLSTSYTVEPGEDVLFSINFSPSGIGEKTAVVSIPCNDPLRTDFSFTIRGEGIAPPEQEIEMWRESTELFKGGLYYIDPPEVALGDEVENLFTIKNTGLQELTLGTPLFWGGNATQFEISTLPDFTVPAGGETSTL